MTTATLTLAEFLLARIAADEASARKAAEAAPGRWASWNHRAHALELRDLASPEAGRIAELPLGADEHIARHDPARVLAECEAKRRIVELHKSWPVLVEGPPEFDQPGSDLATVSMRLTRQIAWLTEQEYRKRFGSEPPTAPILAALALPYADHPDYQQEWRP